MKAKSKKQLSVQVKVQKFVIGALVTVFGIAAILGVGRVVLATTDTSVERDLSHAVIINALQNPESEIALVLAKYILVSEQEVLTNLEASLAGQNAMLAGVTADVNQVRAERLCLKYSDTDYKYNCSGWGRLVLPSTATTTVSEENLLGVDAVVDYAEAVVRGTVSSSWDLFVGVATSSYVDYNAAAGGIHSLPDSLIDGYQFVTTTVTMDSPDRFNTYRNLINSVNDAGTNGLNTVTFSSSSHVVAFKQFSGFAGGICPDDGVGCEAVTSTNSGFVSGEVRYHYYYDIDL